MFGVLVTADVRCIRFEAGPDGELTEWRYIDDPSVLTEDF
jgi:hypothetical protein